MGWRGRADRESIGPWALVAYEGDVHNRIKERLDGSRWVAGSTMLELAEVVVQVSVGGDRCNFYHQRKITVGSTALVAEWSGDVAEKFKDGT